MIHILNMRNKVPSGANAIRVDRASVLGNPFIMHNESQRDEVCDKYQVWFDEQMSTESPVRTEMERLLKIYKKYDNIYLMCWCAPKRCHAETIRSWIEKEAYGVPSEDISSQFNNKEDTCPNYQQYQQDFRRSLDWYQ